jgi:hypothetical protein
MKVPASPWMTPSRKPRRRSSPAPSSPCGPCSPTSSARLVETTWSLRPAGPQEPRAPARRNAGLSPDYPGTAAGSTGETEYSSWAKLVYSGWAADTADTIPGPGCRVYLLAAWPASLPGSRYRYIYLSHILPVSKYGVFIYLLGGRRAKAKFLVAKKGDSIVALGIPKQKSGGFRTTSVEIRPRLRLQTRCLLIK